MYILSEITNLVNKVNKISNYSFRLFENKFLVNSREKINARFSIRWHAISSVVKYIGITSRWAKLQYNCIDNVTLNSKVLVNNE